MTCTVNQWSWISWDSLILPEKTKLFQVNLQIVTISWRTDIIIKATQTVRVVNFDYPDLNYPGSTVNKTKILFQNAISFLVIYSVYMYKLLLCILLHIIAYFLNHLISEIFAVEKKKVPSQHILCNFSSPVLNLLTPKWLASTV